MRIGRWSDPRFFSVCQLVEVLREADANETSGEDGLAFPVSLVRESQLRIPKLEPDFIFYNKVPLVSVELEYHAEWCALKSPSIRVPSSSSDGPGKKGNLLRKILLGYVDGGNDQLRVSQRGPDGQLLQMRFYQSLVIQASGRSLSTCESR